MALVRVVGSISTVVKAFSGNVWIPTHLPTRCLENEGHLPFKMLSIRVGELYLTICLDTLIHHWQVDVGPMMGTLSPNVMSRWCFSKLLEGQDESNLTT